MSREQPRVGWGSAKQPWGHSSHPTSPTQALLGPSWLRGPRTGLVAPRRALWDKMLQGFSLDVPGGTAGVFHPWDIQGLAVVTVG